MIFEKVLDTINRHNLIEKGDKITETKQKSWIASFNEQISFI